MPCQLISLESPHVLSRPVPRTSSLSAGWFILSVITLIESQRYDQICSRANVSLSLDNRVGPSSYEVYLNESQLQYFLSIPEIEVSQRSTKFIRFEEPLKPRKQTLSGSSNYVVRATEGWTPQDPSVKLIQAFPRNLFLLEGVPDPESFAQKDPRIRTIHTFPKLTTKNRYVSGFLESGSQTPTFANGRQLSNHLLQSKLNLTGLGQFVVIADSGLDPLHPFFLDETQPTPTKDPNYDHRKVVAIVPVTDTGDIKDRTAGHGTHCAGTIAGKTSSDEPGLAMYSGVAPDAKLYVFDLNSIEGMTEVELVAMNPFLWIADLNTSNGFGVSSHSYGADYSNFLLSYMWDLFATQFPDWLNVFAAGNEGAEDEPFTINCAGDAKNVLSVGATTAPHLAKLESGRNWFVEIGGVTHELKVVTGSVDPWKATTANPGLRLANISDIHVVKDPQELCLLVNATEYPAIILTSEEEAPDCGNDFHVPVFYLNGTLSDVSTASIYALPKEQQQEFERAYFSSIGPNFIGTLKPDIVAPGSGTISAKAGNPDSSEPRPLTPESLIAYSGTSMATPAVAGLATLIRQFFVDGHYPLITELSDPIIPRSTLLRAMLINSASQLARYSNDPSPNFFTGYGIPDAGDSIGLKGKGLRIVNAVNISANTKHRYRISIDRNDTDLSITVSYIDVALYALDTYQPLYADLDLFVVSPSGKLFVGNGLSNNETNEFSTNERVLIKAEEVEIGDYTIEIISHEMSDVNYPVVEYSMAVLGPFDQRNFAKNPVPMTRDENVSGCLLGCGTGVCNSNGICECGDDHFGYQCEREIESYDMQVVHKLKLHSRRVTYGKTVIGFSNGKDDPPILVLKPVGTALGYITIATSVSRPITHLTDSEIGFFRSGTSPWTIEAKLTIPDDVPPNFTLYWAVYFVGLEDPEYSYSLSVKNYPSVPSEVPSVSSEEPSVKPTDEGSSGGNESKLLLPMPAIIGIVVGIVVVLVIIVVVVVIVRRRKGPEVNEEYEVELNSEVDWKA